jgi:hypothetical protein
MAQILDMLINAQKTKATVEVSSYGKTVRGVVEAVDPGLVTVKETEDSTTYFDTKAIQVVKTCSPK